MSGVLNLLGDILFPPGLTCDVCGCETFDGKNICLQLFTEVDGKHIPLIVDGNKQFKSAFVALLYDLFGEDYYEQ